MLGVYGLFQWPLKSGFPLGSRGMVDCADRGITVENKITAVWLLSISLCGLGICAPNTWTLTQTVCSRNLVGTVSGIQNFGGNIGGIIAPALTGFIADKAHSFAPALMVCGAILVVGIFSYMFLIRQAPAHEPEAKLVVA